MGSYTITNIITCVNFVVYSLSELIENFFKLKVNDFKIYNNNKMVKPMDDKIVLKFAKHRKRCK